MKLFVSHSPLNPHLLGRNYALLGISIDAMNSHYHIGAWPASHFEAMLSGYNDALLQPIVGENAVEIPDDLGWIDAFHSLSERLSDEFLCLGYHEIKSPGQSYFIPGCGESIYTIFKHKVYALLFVVSFNRTINIDSSSSTHWTIRLRSEYKPYPLEYSHISGVHDILRGVVRSQCPAFHTVGASMRSGQFDTTIESLEHRTLDSACLQAVAGCLTNIAHSGFVPLNSGKLASRPYVGASHAHKAFDDKLFFSYFNESLAFKE